MPVTLAVTDAGGDLAFRDFFDEGPGLFQFLGQRLAQHYFHPEVAEFLLELGRKVRNHFLYPPHGIPRAGGTRKRILRAGIEWVGRTAGTKDGRPQLEDGRVLDVANVIWCTGFVTDYRWIDLPVFDSYGYPIHARGVVESHPGLYFMGLLFQRSLSSALIMGVGKDATDFSA